MCRQQRLLQWVRLPHIIGSLRNAKKNQRAVDFISGWFAFPRDHAATQVILRCSSSCLARCYKWNYVTGCAVGVCWSQTPLSGRCRVLGGERGRVLLRLLRLQRTISGLGGKVITMLFHHSLSVTML